MKSIYNFHGEFKLVKKNIVGVIQTDDEELKRWPKY